MTPEQREFVMREAKHWHSRERRLLALLAEFQCALDAGGDRCDFRALIEELPAELTSPQLDAYREVLEAVRASWNDTTHRRRPG